MYCIYAAPQGAKMGRNDKGIASAGRPPSLLIVAIISTKLLLLPLDITCKHAYAA